MTIPLSDRVGATGETTGLASRTASRYKPSTIRTFVRFSSDSSPILTAARAWGGRVQMDNGSEAGVPHVAQSLETDRATVSFWRRIRNALRDIWLTARRGLPEQRYAERTLQRMADGKLRDTLGLQVRDEAATREKAERWLAQMIELGLRPDHLCVEYGCGSLWCAE